MLSRQNQTDWQSTLWREWRNCGNGAYAKQLYELLADRPVGWETKTTYIVLDAIIGLVAGMLLGFLWTTQADTLQQLSWAGGVIGAAKGFLAVRGLTWRIWLERLAFGLPARQPSRGLAALLGLMLLGSLIFGPFLWLLVIGLFWGMSGLIQWMMQGLTTAKPFDYHAWYVWWRGRPPAVEVEAALQQAYEVEKERPPTPTSPVELLTSSPFVEIDFLQLREYARRREVPPV